MTSQSTLIRYDLILGSRRFSNYLWLIISFIGGMGFFIVGISSYSGLRILPFGNTDSIQFIPQGIVMTFYGTIGILLSLFLLSNIIFDIGGGYNKYDKKTGVVEIFRLGFPIQVKEIYLTYTFKEIRSIKLSIQEGLNPKREI